MNEPNESNQPVPPTMPVEDPSAPYLDPARPVTERVNDLVSRMTLQEKVSQMVHEAVAIPRLGVAEHNWWNECLHGVARAGIATVFPQAIGLAATWDVELVYRVAWITSDEARAKHHDAARRGDYGQYLGLTFWTPNINIFRDPRWGRGQETYGECPYLTARMGVAFVTGLQGDDEQYLKLVATPKHFAVHSGPEKLRHEFDAVVDGRDLWETYLPAFEACVVEAGAVSVMGAYNRTNGEPCCASPTLLGEILRAKWGFDGYVVSDCGAIEDICKRHKVVATAPEAAALAVRNGCELNCGRTYPHLLDAVERGLIDEATIDTAVKRLFAARIRLGMFDPPGLVPYAQIPIEVNDCQPHRELAAAAARESIVLLKNDGGLLPLDRSALRSVAVIGPNADSVDVLLGNYNGTPSWASTPLTGLRDKLGADVQVRYALGCEHRGEDTSGYERAVAIAREADVVIACLGLSASFEGEEGKGTGDREDLSLPPVQEGLLRALCETGKPVVLVLMAGSPVSVYWAGESEKVPAILMAWYPGEEGGAAIADVLLGDCNPGARLPVTFPKSVDQLPAFADYRMAGRTYRFMESQPLYPFGHGLSYTSFRYEDLRVARAKVPAGEPVQVSVDVTNTGGRGGEEVVQVYVWDVESSVRTPIRQLAAFARVPLAAGERRTVTLTVAPERMRAYTDEGEPFIEPGTFGLSAGGGQPITGPWRADENFVTTTFEVVAR